LFAVVWGPVWRLGRCVGRQPWKRFELMVHQEIVCNTTSVPTLLE
jgi:hypothetical protein